MIAPRRRAVAVLAIGSALLAAAVRRRRHLAPVAPELRSPVLYAPFGLTSDRAVRVVQSLATRAAASMPTPDGVHMSEEIVAGEAPGGVRVVVYRPVEHTGATRSGALLWIHGGGYVIGTPEQDHDLCASVVRDLGISVVSVDYRLAPDHPFPAGLEDCHAALRWLHDHAAELGIDRTRIAIGGASAGGGLAASLAQLAHDRGGPPICFQLLLYPMLDDRTEHEGRPSPPVWSAASNRYAWAAYLGAPGSATSVLPPAAAARRVDLGGLPPAWIGVGDVDLFHDECVDYARRLRDAGVATELHVVAGMYHAAERFAPRAPIARDFTARALQAVQRAIVSDEAARPVGG